MKQFRQALKAERTCSEYLRKKFPNLSDAKLKEGIFKGSQIREILNNENFITSINLKQKVTWTSFKKVTENNNMMADFY